MLRLPTFLLIAASAQVACAGDAVRVVVPDFAIRVEVPRLTRAQVYLTARSAPQQTATLISPAQNPVKAAPQQKATPQQSAKLLTPRQNIKAAPRQTAARTVLSPTQKGPVAQADPERPILACLARGFVRCALGRRLPEARPGPIP